MLLYKYRSLENIKYFLDIILYNRLYAAPYFELNDPMEGLYLYSGGVVNESMIKKITGEKEKIKICSLSRTPSSTLMWSHYANSHKGVVIEVEVNNTYETRPINYNGPLSVSSPNRYDAQQTARDILSRKLKAWQYEEESRIFVTDGNYVTVKVTEVTLGSNISSENRALVTNLLQKVNPDIIISESKIEKIIWP